MKIRDIIYSANTGLDAIKRAPVLEYPTDLRCIRIQDISQGKPFSEWAYTKTTANDYKKFKLCKNDVLVARTGATVGVSYLVKEDIESVFNNGSIRLRVNENANAKFLYYLINTKEFLTFIDNVSCVATQPNLRIENLLRFDFPDYSVEKQTEIANILSTYDDLIENNNKRIKLLEQMAENLYKEWFVRFRFSGYGNTEFENGLPKGWEIYQAQNLFDISIGRTPDRKRFDYFTTNSDDALWVSISDMKDNMFITKSSEYLTDEAIKKVNMPMVEADTVLLSFKLSVGRVSITTKQSCTNEAIAHFKTNDKELLEYTYLYLKLFNYQNLGNTSAIGNAVNSTIIKKMKFLLPNCELIQEFHNCTKDIFTQIKNVMNKNENLIKQRDLLLPRLMSGKLEV